MAVIDPCAANEPRTPQGSPVSSQQDAGGGFSSWADLSERGLLWYVFYGILLCAFSVSNAFAQYPTDISFRARGGMSYLQDVADSQLGAIYGFDMAVPLFDQANAYGSFTHNHFEQGSQYLGTVGSFRQGLGSGDLLQSLSGGVLFDQYTDTRFDGLYLSQFRFFTGYAFCDQMAAGVTYTNPIEDADSVMVSLPGGGTGPAVLQNAELVEAYLSLSWENHLVTASVGQRQDPNDLVGSLYAARLLNPNLLLYTNTAYADDSLWAFTCGLQWAFGGPTPRRQPGLLAASYSDTSTVVRGQNSTGRANPYVDPSLGHNLNLDPQRFSSLITSASGGSFTSLGGTSLDGSGSLDPLDGPSGGVTGTGDREIPEIAPRPEGLPPIN